MTSTHTIEVQGLALAYTVHTPSGPSAGVPVLALHGWGASSALMSGPSERLAALGYAVYALDLPGFGATPPPAVPWGVPDYAAFVAAALATLGIERPHLIGHSFGGRISLVLGADYAPRVGRLALADSAGVPPKRPLLPRARLGLYKATRRSLERVGANSTAQRLRVWYARRYGSADYQQTSGVMRETFVRVVNQDLRPFAARIQASTLLFWGSADEDTPLWQGRELERVIPDAGLIVLEGAGHYSYLDRLDEFVRVTDYFFKQEQAAQL